MISLLKKSDFQALKFYPDETVRRIWNSLRKRYKVNPKKFKTQKELIDFLEKVKSPALRIAKSKKFWEKSKEKIVISYTRTQRYKVPVTVKSYRYKVYTRRVLRKVWKIRKDGVRQRYRCWVVEKVKRKVPYTYTKKVWKKKKVHITYERYKF
jgi:hypothetical protein